MVTTPYATRVSSKIAFFHVMKTGGMTFRKILKTIYGDSFRLSNEASLEKVQQEIAGFDCVEFHVMPEGNRFFYPHSSLVQGRRWDLLAGRESFTMLRNPSDRYVSQYYYLVSIRERIEPAMNANGYTFPASILSFGGKNEQVGFLTGRFPDDGGGEINRRDLELAKEMLVSLGVHVGVMERFADSMNVFETVTGLKIAGDAIQVENRNRQRRPLASIPRYVQGLIRERNELDVELYEFGKELFLQDLARCRPTREYSFIHGQETHADAGAGMEKDETGDGTWGNADGQHTAKSVVFDPMFAFDTDLQSYLTGIYGEFYHLYSDVSIEAIEARLQTFQCVEFSTIPCDGDFISAHRQLARLDRWDLLDGKVVLVVLQDPVDFAVRKFSLTVQMRPFLEPVYAARGRAFPESLEEYIEAPENRNAQLAFLCVKGTALSGGTPDRADLEQMKSVLLRLGAHVGLRERLAEYFAVLQAVTRLEPNAEAGSRNIDSGRTPLDMVPGAVLDRIRELNTLDRELYEFGRTLFQADLDKLRAADRKA